MWGEELRKVHLAAGTLAAAPPPAMSIAPGPRHRRAAPIMLLAEVARRGARLLDARSDAPGVPRAGR